MVRGSFGLCGVIVASRAVEVYVTGHVTALTRNMVALHVKGRQNRQRIATNIHAQVNYITAFIHFYIFLEMGTLSGGGGEKLFHFCLPSQSG